jgi:hypothetical protein
MHGCRIATCAKADWADWKRGQAMKKIWRTPVERK